MAQQFILQHTFDFLDDLGKNNNRDWFNAHKARYEKALHNVTAFSDTLLGEMRTHDNIATPSGKASLYRIYNDTRFAKDKPPYKKHFGGRFSRATDYLRGGYYFHLEPGNSFMGGGFFAPNPDDLKRIREDIALNTDEWKALFESPAIAGPFGSLRGESVKTAPKGYDKDHEGIEWLRMKQFILRHDFTDEEVMSKEFVYLLNDTFRQLRPFFDLMSEILTTNVNGEPVL